MLNAAEALLNLAAQLPAGRVSVVTHAPWPIAAGEPVCGLYVDEWTEVVPHDTETTGITFQFDEPKARAPHAWLLAVAPPRKRRWKLATLAQTLLETFELGKLRAVDPDALREIGHYLPALYFAINLAGDAVSTDFTRAGR